MAGGGNVDLKKYGVNAGAFRHRVEIQAQALGNDSVGQPNAEWLPLVTLKCAIEPITGRELMSAGADYAGVTDRIVVRYVPGITQDMRAIHRGDVYNIKSVIDVQVLHRLLILLCERGVRVYA